MTSSESLLEERREFGLPPYSRLVDLRLKAIASASTLCESIVSSGFRSMELADSVRVVLPRDKQLQANKKKLRKIVETFRSKSKSDVIIDVDPL